MALSYLEFDRDLTGGMLHGLRDALVILKLPAASALKEPKPASQYPEPRQKREIGQIAVSK